MDAPFLGRYLLGKFNVGWIDDIGFLEGANGKGKMRERADKGV